MWEIMSRIMNLKSGTPLQAPEMTTAEIHALTGVEDGMIVYNTDTRQLLTHVAGSWLAISNSGSAGTVTNVDTGVGLIGGPITGAGTIALDNTGVEAGEYIAANITVDAQGRITAAESGDIGTVDSVVGTEGQIVVNSDDPTNPVVSLADTSVAPGEYTAANITVDAQGRIIAASSDLIPETTTPNSIVTWGANKNLLNNPNTQIDNAGNMTLPGTVTASSFNSVGNLNIEESGKLRITSASHGVLQINASSDLSEGSTANVNFGSDLTFPSNLPLAGQTIRAIDELGNLGWQYNVASVMSPAGTIEVDSSDPMNVNIDLPTTGVEAATYTNPSSITFDEYGRATAVTSGASTSHGMLVLTSGSGTLASQLPAGVTSGKVTVIGGGGRGGNTSSTSSIGTGGGAGGTAIRYVTDLSSSSSYSVGAAGAASTFTTGTVLMEANAGQNGGPATSATLVAGGAGGTAIGGTINITGQSGANVSTASTVGSGAGGNSFFNGGGRAVTVTGNGIAASVNSGSGGSGAFKNAAGIGGAGGSGVIIIEY
jgi:hypothetical protein